MFEYTSAFISPTRSQDIFAINPPVLHKVAYATGGCKGLYDSIKNQEYADSTDEETFTDYNGNFIPHPNMPLLGKRYKFLNVIGSGESSLLIKAKDTFQNNKEVAIKVLNLNYQQLGCQETDCIMKLNKADPCGVSGTLRIYNTLTFAGHFCMVFEMLDPLPIEKYNLYTHGLISKKSLSNIRDIAVNLLKSLGFLQQQNVIHGDLKPDNILLKTKEDFKSVTIVDFGNAIQCVHEELSLYYDNFEFQTLVWRAPEVIFGMNFGLEVDIWSYGCILAELYLGKPIFYGKTKEEVLAKMIDLLGYLPAGVFQRGKYYTQLKEFTSGFPQKDCTLTLMKKLGICDFQFANFLAGCFKYNPSERITITEAAKMPFLGNYYGFGFLIPPNYKGERMHCENITTIPCNSYPYKPLVSNSSAIHMSSYELLKDGTSDCHSNQNYQVNDQIAPWMKGYRKIAQVSPVQKHDSSDRTRYKSPSLESNQIQLTQSNRPSAFHPISNVEVNTKTHSSKIKSQYSSLKISSANVLIKPTPSYGMVYSLEAIQNITKESNLRRLKDNFIPNIENCFVPNIEHSTNGRIEVEDEMSSDTDNNATFIDNEEKYDAYINCLMKQTKTYLDRAEKVANINTNDISNDIAANIKNPSNIVPVMLLESSKSNIGDQFFKNAKKYETESSIHPISSSPLSATSNCDSVVGLLPSESSCSNSPDLNCRTLDLSPNNPESLDIEDEPKMEQPQLKLPCNSRCNNDQACQGDSVVLNETFTVSAGDIKHSGQNSKVDQYHQCGNSSISGIPCKRKLTLAYESHTNSKLVSKTIQGNDISHSNYHTNSEKIGCSTSLHLSDRHEAIKHSDESQLGQVPCSYTTGKNMNSLQCEKKTLGKPQRISKFDSPVLHKTVKEVSAFVTNKFLSPVNRISKKHFQYTPYNGSVSERQGASSIYMSPLQIRLQKKLNLGKPQRIPKSTDSKTSNDNKTPQRTPKSTDSKTSNDNKTPQRIPKSIDSKTSNDNKTNINESLLDADEVMLL